VELLHTLARAKNLSEVNLLLLLDAEAKKNVALHPRVIVDARCSNTGGTLAHLFVSMLARIEGCSYMSVLPTLQLLLPTQDLIHTHNFRGDTVLHELMRPGLAPLLMALLRDSPPRIQFDWFVRSNAGYTPRELLMTLKTHDNETGFPVRAVVQMHEKMWFTGSRTLILAALSHQCMISDVAGTVLDYLDGGIPAQACSKP